MLTAKQIAFSYNSQNQLSFPDLSFEQGAHALILGKSGCGKTTLLHILAGLLKPTQGEVLINNQSLYKLREGERDVFRGNEIGIVFQTPHFLNALSIKENLFLAQTLAGNKKDENRVKEMLRELDLSAKINSLPKNLSQGQKQRVSIARALINSPQLILADEPTSALDDDNCTAVVELLKSQAEKQNATLLIVTHDNRLSDLFETKIRL